MRKMYWISLTGVLLISLNACSTTALSSAQKRDQYLQQFIGQSRTSILQHFSLADLHYQSARPLQSTPKTLIYSFVRPMSIPLSVAYSPVTGTGAVPIPIQHDRSVHDQSIECQIVFQLEQDIAISAHTQGRSC